MTLRNRLLVAAGACLLVVIAAFLGVQRRQQQVLFEQLDAQLAVVANSASSFAERSPLIGPPSFGNNGDLYLRNNSELYIGAVIDDAVLTIAAPASTPSLVPSLDELQRAPRENLIKQARTYGVCATPESLPSRLAFQRPEVPEWGLLGTEN